MAYKRTVTLNYENADKVVTTTPHEFQDVTINGDLDFAGAQTFEELITAEKGIVVDTIGIGITAGDVGLTNGDITVSQGNVDILDTSGAGLDGNLAVENDLTVTAGDIEITAGDLTLVVGDVEATAGNIEAIAGRVIGAAGLSTYDIAGVPVLHTITGDADANMLWDAKVVDAATYKRIEEFEISGSGAALPLWTYVIPENTSVSISGYIHCIENSAGPGVSANTGRAFSVRASDMAGYRYAGATGAIGAVALTQVDLIDHLVGGSTDPVFSYTVAANGTFELAVDTGDDGAAVNNAFLMRGTLEVIEVPHT
jgi:hypothetical protein